MVKGCCGNNKLPDVLVKKRLVKAQLIDTKIAEDCEGKDVFAGDKVATCKDLENVKNSIDDEIKGSLNQGANLPADAEDCDRPVSICGVNNMLNAAEDNKAKQAVANAIKDKALKDKDFRIVLGKALLSKKAGNRIEARDDGIGVWDDAPPDLRVQYVDALDGDDDNPGTKDKPLRTFKRAITRIEAGTGYGKYVISLKVGQTHILQGKPITLPNATLTISGYGGTKYKYRSDEQPYPGYYIWEADDYQRPTLSVKKHTYIDSGGTERALFAYANVGSLDVRGVNLHIEDGAPTNPGSGRFWMWGPGAVGFSGSDVYIGTGNSLGRVKSVFFSRSRLSMGDGASLVDVQYGCAISAVPDSLVATENTAPNLPSYMRRTSNVRGALTPENLGAQFDRPTKRLFGASTSWDIFANS